MEPLPGGEIREWKLLWGGNPTLSLEIWSLNLSEPLFITNKADGGINPTKEKLTACLCEVVTVS